MPDLTFELEDRLEKDGIEKSQLHFIRHWAAYLNQQTRGRPTKDDYMTIAASIVGAYPALKGGHSSETVRSSTFPYLFQFFNLMFFLT